jgi:Reverse transcriptase (RNA-dependent DNA polymerase)
MLAQNIIEPATCEWASPIVLVPQPDVALRFCVDYRKLKIIIVPDTYPLLRMEKVLIRWVMQQCLPLSTATAATGKHRFTRTIAIRQRLLTIMEYTDFYGSPLGSETPPRPFKGQLTFSGVKWKTCLVYLDDAIVFSENRAAHLTHIAEVLTLLGNAGLSLKLKKCHLFSSTVDYLGHVIRPGRLGVAEKNTVALRTAPLPRTQTVLRSFLGLCNF